MPPEPTDKSWKHASLRQEYYQQLILCSSFAVIGVDCQGIIISWNVTAKDMFQAEPQQMLGKHIEIIIPENRRRLVERLIEKTVSERAINEFEIEHRLPGGRIATLAAVITPVTDPEGELLGMAVWIRDITNRKLLQQQLAESEKMASLGTLAAGVAHHFNNIIGGVGTVVDFALQARNPQTTERALKMTAEAAGRMGKITQSLLTFAERDMRKCDLSDLTEVLLTFTNLAERPLAEKNIELELQLHGCPLYEVPGTRIHQILSNLLENACFAMQAGGKITISLTQADPGITLSFSDTGSGIEPANLPQIFDPFFTTKDVVCGGDQHFSGLGLSVVHGIVRELHGRIEVTSKMNKGTTFKIFFPPK